MLLLICLLYTSKDCYALESEYLFLFDVILKYYDENVEIDINDALERLLRLYPIFPIPLQYILLDLLFNYVTKYSYDNTKLEKLASMIYRILHQPTSVPMLLQICLLYTSRCV